MLAELQELYQQETPLRISPALEVSGLGKFYTKRNLFENNLLYKNVSRTYYWLKREIYYLWKEICL